MSLVATPPSGGLGPAQIAAAYDLSALPAGTGTIVAVIDEPDYYAASDLAGYRQGYGLPVLPVCPTSENGGLPLAGGSPCFAAVDETGALFTPSPEQDSQGGGDFETALDMDMVSAVCPECSILLVQITGQGNAASNSGYGDILAAVQTASGLGGAAISISLGGPESTDPLIGGTTDPTGYSTHGHLVFAAAGDFGYDEETLCGAEDAGCGAETVTTPSYPASAPDVIAVGGTTLYNANGAGTYTESVWDDGVANAQDVTTSGCSSEFASLSWQQSQTGLPATSCKRRASADLSAAAAYTTTMTPPTTAAEAFASDIVIYSTSAPSSGIDGFSGGIEGTSAASPMVAAIFARLGLTKTLTDSLTAGSLGWPYFNQAAFNDVTAGTDDVNSISNASLDGFSFGPQCTGADLLLCTAGVGWDGPTGVGTPNGVKLLALLTGTAVADAGSSEAGGALPLVNDAAVAEDDAGTPLTEPNSEAYAVGSPAQSGCACAVPAAGGDGAGPAGVLLGLTALGSRLSRRRKTGK